MSKTKLHLKQEYAPLTKREMKEARSMGNTLAISGTRNVLPLPFDEIRENLEASETGVQINKLYVDDGFLIIKYKGKPKFSAIGKYVDLK
jgi:hypothetical protein